MDLSEELEGGDSVENQRIAGYAMPLVEEKRTEMFSLKEDVDLKIG